MLVRNSDVWSAGARLALFVLLASFAPSLHASSFSVSIPDQAIFNSPTTVGVAGNGVINNAARSASAESLAVAGTGVAGARTLVGVSPPNALRGDTGQSFATASETVDDLVFGGPLPTITLLNGIQIPYIGTFGYDVAELSDGVGDESIGIGTVDLTLNASVGCFNCAVGFTGSTNVHLISNGTPDVTIGRANNTSPNVQLVDLRALPITGFFVGHAFEGVDRTLIYGITGVFDTGPITFPTGVPISIFLSINGSASALGQSISNANSFFDLSHTLGFPQGVPVFNLPPGFTANAPSIGLVNNVIGPAVPEPASLALSAIGLVCVRILRRRRTL